LSGPNLKRRQRLALAKRDGAFCFYCGPSVPYRLHELTRDHVTPASAGGPGVRRNLVLACFRHNNVRGNEPFISFVSKHPAAIKILQKQSPIFISLAREAGFI
jgi:5-methylcytosine-specific restriction endonuclease McrA